MLLLALTLPVYSWNSPTDESMQTGIRPSIGFNLALNEWDFYFHTEAGFSFQSPFLKNLLGRFGTNFKFHPNWKVGILAQVENGGRHDNDWIDGGGDIWVWKDTMSRWETSFGVDLSPRFLLEFLPERNAVLQLRLRYLYNTFNSDQSLHVRPGLSWFIMEGRDPVFSAHLAWEGYFGLTFSRDEPYGQAYYLTLSQPLTGEWSLEYGAQYGWKSWDEPDIYAVNDWGTYKVTQTNLEAKIGVVYRSRVQDW